MMMMIHKALANAHEHVLYTWVATISAVEVLEPYLCLSPTRRLIAAIFSN